MKTPQRLRREQVASWPEGGDTTLKATKTAVVAGPGGFIASQLVAVFRNAGGCHIRLADIKPFDEWYQVFDDVKNGTGPLAGEARDVAI